MKRALEKNKLDVNNKRHVVYMNKCIQLAKKAKNDTFMNPLVGSVIVKDGKIIGSGYHMKYGGNHAEIEAITSARKHTSDFKDTTLYVNLEPCVHFGKVGPCVNTIIESGIKNIVIGMIDPNPIVHMKGIKMLEDANCKVTILYDIKSRELNKIFNITITKHRPFIHLKLALTQDFALTDVEGTSSKITSEKSDKKVHELRSKYDAIMVGANTIKIDNPQLSVRLKNTIHYPTRIIIDPKGSLSNDYKVFKQNDKYIHIKGEEYMDEGNTLSWEKVMKKIYVLGIRSILVEGGYMTAETLFENKMVDEITLIVQASKKSRNAPHISKEITDIINNSKTTKHKTGDETWYNYKLWDNK